MMYFNDVNNLNELKSRFRQWAFKLHPDKGGNAKEFMAMQQEYEVVYRQLKRNEEEGKQSNHNAGAGQRSTIWEDLRRKYHEGPTTGPKAGPTKRKKAHKPDDDGYFNKDTDNISISSVMKTNKNQSKKIQFRREKNENTDILISSLIDLEKEIFNK